MNKREINVFPWLQLAAGHQGAIHIYLLPSKLLDDYVEAACYLCFHMHTAVLPLNNQKMMKGCKRQMERVKLQINHKINTYTQFPFNRSSLGVLKREN